MSVQRKGLKRGNSYYSVEDDLLQEAKKGGRQHALNLKNRDTLEFRLFKGTLNIEHFIAAIQMINILCTRVCELTLDDTLAISFTDLLRSDYTELNAYLVERDS